MPTDTAQHPHSPAFRFALRAVAWSLGLFGVLRLSAVELYAVLPLTQFQGRLAERAFGAPSLPIDVTLACSGADAIALCAGAVLAYPVAWRKRLAGAAGGIALILVLNTLRIGTLGQAAASPSWFNALHIYAWPAVLALAVAGYVFAWMRAADRRRAVQEPAFAGGQAAGQPVEATRGVTRQFAVLTVAFVAVFTAAAPLYLESGGVLAAGAYMAGAAAWGLRAFGMEAIATGNVLATANGRFLVTQECITTPLIPVYLAAVCAYVARWRWRVPALLAAVPLFAALGIARLLVVALPATLVGSPVFLVHAFYQLLLAAVVVVAAACWRHGPGAIAWRRAALGAAAGGAFIYLLGPLYRRTLAWTLGSPLPLADPQGALALLPAFQIGLFVALSVAALATLKWRPVATGLALLALSQVGVFAALQFGLPGDGFAPHVREVRAWAIAGPLLVAALLIHDRPRR